MAKAIIHLEQLRHNLQRLRGYLSDSKLMIALKANAYGHGAVRFAHYLEAQGISHFAVATPEEALELRRAGINSIILILTPVQTALYDASLVRELIATQVRFALMTKAQWQDLQGVAQGEKLYLHLKVDTGMGRLGQSKAAALELAQTLAKHNNSQLEGVWTHFATADEADSSYTYEQLEHFHTFLAGLKQQGIEVPLRHCANSAATIAYPESHLDMVRAGIALYGYAPSAHIAALEPALRPVMEVRAPVTFIKRIRAGQSISYARLWQSQQATTIASLRIGYGDGYPRILSNQAQVAFAGQRFALRGRVCMDQIMVDVVDTTIAVGDEITVMAGAAPDAEALAQWSGRSSYEILCNIGKRVQREYRP